MDCEHFARNLDNYEDLTEDERLEMTQHAAECESCGRELDFMLSIIETAKSLPKVELPPDFMDKLNVRIDAEERKRRGMASRIRANVVKNWRQYTTAAACLALVAVITSNGMGLVSKMPISDNNVVYNNETQPQNDMSPVITPEVKEVNVSENREKRDNSDTDSVFSDGNAPDKALSNDPVKKPVRVASSDTKTYSVRVTPKAAVSALKEDNIKAESDEPLSENMQPEYPGEDTSAMEANIAVANLSDNENGIVAFSNEPEEGINVNGRSIQDDYSIANGGELMIAKYEPPQDGEDADSKKAIGKIKISSKDIDEAMDVIMQHAHDVKGDYYTTDSANLSLMLSSLIQKGVNYTNYTPAYEGNIQFQLVIE